MRTPKSAMLACALTALLGWSLPTAAQEPGAGRPRPAMDYTLTPLGEARALAPALRRNVTLDLKAAPLVEAIAAIERQAGLSIVYSSEDLPRKRVTLRSERLEAAAALVKVLEGTGVGVFVALNGQVVLVKQPKALRTTTQPPGAIVGRVTDVKSGENIAGAEVLLEGTRWRASTGADGRYRVSDVTAGNYTLTVRRIGYAKTGRAVVVAADQELMVDVALLPVATQLNEIVTTVTGEQRRVELGHVVGRINADSLVKEAPVSSISELLTGRVPGLQVFQAQGTVGGQVSLQVRGPNTFSPSATNTYGPIVVVDGVRYTTEQRRRIFVGAANREPSSPLNDLNPNDIETIEVVKGPSAATLYGTDAANGVLVITTKRGRPGPPRWNTYVKGTVTSIPKYQHSDIYFGWGNIPASLQAFWPNCNLDLLGSGLCPRQDSITVLRNPLNDPEYTLFAPKPRWEYGLNVAGGSQDLRYYFSGDFENATGPLQMPPAVVQQLQERRGLRELPREWREPNAFTKLNLRSNISAMLGKKADVLVSTGFIRSDTRNIAAGGDVSGYRSPLMGVFQVNLAQPGSSPYGPDGLDPAELFVQESNEQSRRFVGNASGNWRPASWLTARATLGQDLMHSYRYSLARPGDTRYAIGRTGQVEDTRTEQSSTTLDVGATAIARRGRVSARTAAGLQYVRSLRHDNATQGTNLPPGGSSIREATTIVTFQTYSEAVVLGGYLEEMLGLNDRLFLTGALRIDGASTFGRDYNATIYPKAGVSWLVSQEPFAPRVPGLDELRLRFALGASGLQPPPARSRPGFQVVSMDLGGQRVPGMWTMSLGNPELRPERVREHEFGFDASLLENRVNLDATWFRRRTTDLMVDAPSPAALGGRWTNLGLVTQRGFEARLEARVLETRLLSWDLTLQHSDYATKLLDLGGGRVSRHLHGGWVEGYPLGSRWQVPVVGWEDRNGNGIIQSSEVQLADSAVYMGQSTPPRSQTLTTVVGLFERRLRLSATFDRRTGFTQVNEFWCRGGTCREAVDRNTPFADQVRALRIGQGNAGGLGGRTPEKGDFTRLREVTAALDLPAALTRAVRAHSATVVLSARNLALWTDFSGPDPESADLREGFMGGSASGVPQSRVVSLRLDLNF